MTSQDLDLLLTGVVGSTAYGLAREGSDIDQLGVYLAPTQKVLGLGSHAATSASHVSHEPDVTLHELGKYCSLALKGNPTVLELLYCDTYTVRTELGDRLIALRSAFLSEPAVRGAYVGYATEQARRLANRHKNGMEGFDSTLRNRTEKHGRHCARLMLQAHQLLTTGTLTLDVSEFRTELFAAGELAASDPEGFQTVFLEQAERIATVESVLPANPDFARVERFVVSARMLNI